MSSGNWQPFVFVSMCLTKSGESRGKNEYRQVSKIIRTVEGNKIVDHSDVVEASPVGAAPSTSSFST